LLIADEPTRNLDVTIQAGILKLINELKNNLGINVLFIANNISLVFIISDRVGILYKGKIIEVGTSQEIKKKPIHPYTKMLLGRTINKENINLIVNDFPCSYFYKCEERMEICKKRIPILTKISNTHWVSCHKIHQ